MDTTPSPSSISSSSPPQTTHLLDLPVEILQEIALHLPYTASVALRWSCAYLYSVISGQPPPRWQHYTPTCISVLDAYRHHFTDLRPSPLDNDVNHAIQHLTKPLKDSELTPRRSILDLKPCMQDLAVFEYWPCFDRKITALNVFNELEAEFTNQAPATTLYACFTCLRLLPMSKFATGQTKGHHGKPTTLSSRSRTEETADAKDDIVGSGSLVLKINNPRYCLQCGVKRGKYSPGQLLQFMVEARDEEAKDMVGTGIVCKRCARFKVTGADTKATLRRLCNECLAYRPP